MPEQQEIIFTEEGGIGCILLNRPKVLNALSLDMCQQIAWQLEKWANDPHIFATLLTGAGDKAFCSGGDIHYVYESSGKGIDRSDEAMAPGFEFVHAEYNMNKAIYYFNKPYISYIHGITFGGGVGVSVNGSHVVTAEDTSLSMPECSIGYFPDVGSGAFLNRYDHRIGMFLALSGFRINVADIIKMRLADAQIRRGDFPAFKKSLIGLENKSVASINQLIKKYASIPEMPPALDRYNDIISKAFGRDNLPSIFEALEQNDSGEAQEILAMLQKISPLSLYLAFRHISKSRNMSLEEVLNEEARVVDNMLRFSDFFEGVRASIIDKTHDAKWQHNSIHDVRKDEVDVFFK